MNEEFNNKIEALYFNFTKLWQGYTELSNLYLLAVWEYNKLLYSVENLYRDNNEERPRETMH